MALSPGASLLCAYLALSPKEGRSRDVVAAHLFSDCAETTARRRLNTALWRLRNEVRESTGVDITAGSTSRRVTLNSAVVMALDCAEFESFVVPVLEAKAGDLTDAEASRLEVAVSMHRGQLLEQCDDEWILARRAHIENLYLTALDYLLQHYGVRGEVGAVAKYGDMALAMEPLREDIHRHLMSAYARAGRDDLVERQFETCRQVLLDEIGADPLPETVALYSRLRRGEHGPSASVGALATELERARREVARLSEIVDRALEHLSRMT